MKHLLYVGWTLPLEVRERERFVPYKTQFPRAAKIYPLTLTPEIVRCLMRCVAARVRISGPVGPARGRYA